LPPTRVNNYALAAFPRQRAKTILVVQRSQESIRRHLQAGENPPSHAPGDCERTVELKCCRAGGSRDDRSVALSHGTNRAAVEHGAAAVSHQIDRICVVRPQPTRAFGARAMSQRKSKLLRTCLVNASAAVAGLILTTDCVIGEKPAQRSRGAAMEDMAA
jgi:hypothetical protein